MELLCIKSHSQGVVVSGNSYPFIRSSENQNDACDCNKYCIDVGITDYSDEMAPVFEDTGSIVPIGTRGNCSVCGKSHIVSGTWWISRDLFAQIATEYEVKESERTKELIEQ